MFNNDWYERVQMKSSEQVLEANKQYCATTTNVDYPFVPWKGDKEFIWNKDGKKCIDFNSGVGCNNLGYNNQRIFEAMWGHMRKHGILGFAHHDHPNPWATELSEMLCKITPGNFPKKVFLACTGTEAVEAAIKMCLKHNLKRRKFFAFKKAFHGRTIGALSLTNSKPIQKQDFPVGLGEDNVCHLPFPEKNTGLKFFNWQYYFQKNKIDLRQFNAIFIELIQGEGGINVADKKNLINLLQLLKQNEVSIVVDEVQTGIMRTGRMFACEYYEIEPDIICLGKGLGSGASISATVAKAEFDYPEKGVNSNTHGGNALNCVAALETLEIFTSWTFHDYAELEGKIKMLSEFSDSGMGMMRRIICETKEERDAIIIRAYKKGLILLGAGEKNIRLMPPLIISKESLKEARRILEECY